MDEHGQWYLDYAHEPAVLEPWCWWPVVPCGVTDTVEGWWETIGRLRVLSAEWERARFRLTNVATGEGVFVEPGEVLTDVVEDGRISGGGWLS